MAQNITLLGASYTAVPAVTLPKTGGGTATFSDPSITTAVESDVAEGKTFLLADGSIGTGTASGGGPSETLLGQTPYTLTEDANIRLKSTSETTYSTGNGVIADFADRENVTLSNATLTNQGSYWELADTGATNWYESTMQFYITGLTPNTTYTARIGGMSDLETYCGGWWGIWDSTGGDMLAGNQFANEGTLEFTPTSSSIRVTAAPAGAYFWERNIKVCRFTNFSIEGETSATFTGSTDLGQLTAGTTITSTPSCDVYAVTESSGGGTLRGKTCVCLGDSVTGFMAPPTDYPSKLAANTGMTVYNCGFAGCRISDTHPTTAYRYFGLTHIADAIASGDWTDQDTYVSSIEAETYPQAHLNNLKNADWDNVDYITIFYGANDAINGVPLGDATGTNIQTVLGAFNHSITAIRTAYPNIHILVFAPEYIYFVSDNMGAESKDITVYGTSETKKFYEWGDAIIQRAAALGVPAVDMYRTLGIDLSNWSTYLKSDGAHPNDAGTTLIAQKFETELYNHFISGGSSATLIAKTITENGTYNASNDSADGYSSVTVNVSGGSAKNVQIAQGVNRVNTTSYSAVSGQTITVATTGTYNIYWTGFRSSTGGTNGSCLYINGTAHSSGNQTTFSNHGQSIKLTGVSLTQGDVLAVRAAARGTNYYMYVGNLTIEQTA